MIVDCPEETDGYNGLYGEVVTEDCYGLSTIDFVPDVIFDIGANIGVFTRYARSLFPKAKIVCVEPDSDNFVHLLKFTPKENIEFIQGALGSEEIWETLNIPNGAHGCFLSHGLGYPKEALQAGEGRNVRARTDLRILRLPELFSTVHLADKVLIKIDVEGNEHTIFTHPLSMGVLHRCDYVAIEVHQYADNNSLLEEVQQKTQAALKTLDETHTTVWNHVVLQARKKS